MATTEDFREREYGRRDFRSTPTLVADLISQATSLFGKEMQLARSELSEKVTQGVAGLAFIVAGAVFLIGAVNVLLAAAVTALMEAGIEAPWSSLIVAGAVALIGALFAFKGMSNLKASNLAPNRTTGTGTRSDGPETRPGFSAPYMVAANRPVSVPSSCIR